MSLFLHEPASIRKPRWSGRRIALLIVSVLSLAISGLYLSERPLQPWDDLKPAPVPALRPGEKNGRAILVAKWDVLPKWNRYEPGDTLQALLAGRICWDGSDPVMVSAALRGADRLAELREALSMSGWRRADLARVSDGISTG